MYPEQASAYLTRAVLHFNEQLEQLERIGEAVVVVTIGAMLSWESLPGGTFWFLGLLFLVIRPASVQLSLLGSSTRPEERLLISWFGIRGIGSVYYLMYAVQHGIPGPLASSLVPLTLAAVAVSILIHGMSVTPLMNGYRSDP